jgi:hypothetical protein
MKIESTKNLVNKAVSICVYGKTGTGKTHLASTIPEKALILNADKGVLTLRKYDIDYVTALAWKDVDSFMKFIGTEECSKKYKWIVFDSMTTIADMLLLHLKNDKGMKGFDLWNEYTEKLGQMIRFIRDQEVYSTLSIYESVEEKDANGIVSHGFGLSGEKLANRIPYFYSNVFSTHCKVKEDKPAYTLQTIPKNGWQGKARGIDVQATEEAHIGKLIKKLLID